MTIENWKYPISFWFFRTGKMMSSWFVVCICVERFVAVLFPFKVKILFTKRRSYVIIAMNILCKGWVKMTVVSENAKAIRKTLADNLENEFEFITHIVRTFPNNPTKRLAGIHMTLRTWRIFRTGKMMSSWFVVCICVERFVAVLFPFKVKILFMKRRRYVIIAIIFLA
jgi:hypothetical protein